MTELPVQNGTDTPAASAPMVAYKQKNTEPVQKITIVPHTQGSLGYTLLMPEEDKTELRTRDELMAKITVSMSDSSFHKIDIIIRVVWLLFKGGNCVIMQKIFAGMLELEDQQW